MRNPTITRAVVAASKGTTVTSGDRNVASRNSTPVTTDARPVRAPSATPAADSIYAVFDDVLAAPPAAAAIESTSRISRVRGGLPFLSIRPPSWPTATMVPMVSKKSVNISVKTNSSAVTMPTSCHEPSRSKWPSSPKSGAPTTLSGSTGTFSPQPLGCLPPIDGPACTIASTMIARIVVPMMPIRMPPLTLRTTSTSIASRPITNTSVGQPSNLLSMPRPTGGTAAPVARTKPASTKPMSARNSPMPTPMAVFNWVGTAWNTAVRSPVSTRTVITRPSMTTRPIASAQVICGAISKATIALTPSPAASASGNRAITPIRIVITPATCAVAAASWVWSRWPFTPSAALPRISGLSTTMYAIVKNVASPPRTSRAYVEPRAVISKNLSIAELAVASCAFAMVASPRSGSPCARMLPDVREHLRQRADQRRLAYQKRSFDRVGPDLQRDHGRDPVEDHHFHGYATRRARLLPEVDQLGDRVQPAGAAERGAVVDHAVGHPGEQPVSFDQVDRVAGGVRGFVDAEHFAAGATLHPVHHPADLVGTTQHLGRPLRGESHRRGTAQRRGRPRPVDPGTPGQHLGGGLGSDLGGVPG